MESCFFVLVMQYYTVFGEVFTALSDMEGLVNTELELVKHLDSYIQLEETRLRRLRGYYYNVE